MIASLKARTDIEKYRVSVQRRVEPGGGRVTPAALPSKTISTATVHIATALENMVLDCVCLSL